MCKPVESVLSDSKKFDSRLGAGFYLLFGPYRGLNLADVSFVKQEHAESALTDAAAYRIGKFAFKQQFVERQFLTILAAADFQLLHKRLGAYADTH